MFTIQRPEIVIIHFNKIIGIEKPVTLNAFEKEISFQTKNKVPCIYKEKLPWKEYYIAIDGMFTVITDVVYTEDGNHIDYFLVNGGKIELRG